MGHCVSGGYAEAPLWRPPQGAPAHEEETPRGPGFLHTVRGRRAEEPCSEGGGLKGSSAHWARERDAWPRERAACRLVGSRPGCGRRFSVGATLPHIERQSACPLSACARACVQHSCCHPFTLSLSLSLSLSLRHRSRSKRCRSESVGSRMGLD